MMKRIPKIKWDSRFGVGFRATVLTIFLLCACERLNMGIYSSPIFSTDGSFFAYVFANRHFTAQNQRDTLYITDMSRGSTSSVLPETNQIQEGISRDLGCGAWSNDAFWASTSELLGHRIYRVNSRTHRSKVITLLENYALRGCSFDPRTPNMLYFASESTIDMAEKSDLYTLDVNTLTVTRLTNTPDVAETAPTWSQDGSFWVYGVSGGVNLQDREGNTRFVSGVNGDAFRYALSSDGKWFLSIGGYRDPGLFLVSAADGASRRISSDAYAYVSWGGDRVALITMGVPGRNELLIKTVEELGIPEQIKALERGR